MWPQSASNNSKALEGLHGVHVVPHSPFAHHEIDQNGEFDSTCESSTLGASQLLLMQRVWQQRPACLRPVHCCIQGDQNLLERFANVLTSLPFIALGIQAPRKNLNTKMYANSLIGVGLASSMYHSSRGRLRRYLRWADYTMIATATVPEPIQAEHLAAGFKYLTLNEELFSKMNEKLVNLVNLAVKLSTCLSRALRDENPKMLMAASALLLPIQPLMVSAVHTGMMEVAFAKRALKDPNLRMTHNVHKLSSLLGGVFFIADDVFPQTPFLHAAWHLAAAVGVGTCNKLLE